MILSLAMLHGASDKPLDKFRCNNHDDNPHFIHQTQNRLRSPSSKTKTKHYI
jgi:hypothetical protein